MYDTKPLKKALVQICKVVPKNTCNAILTYAILKGLGEGVRVSGTNTAVGVEVTIQGVDFADRDPICFPAHTLKALCGLSPTLENLEIPNPLGITPEELPDIRAWPETSGSVPIDTGVLYRAFREADSVHAGWTHMVDAGFIMAENNNLYLVVFGYAVAIRVTLAEGVDLTDGQKFAIDCKNMAALLRLLAAGQRYDVTWERGYLHIRSGSTHERGETWSTSTRIVVVESNELLSYELMRKFTGKYVHNYQGRVGYIARKAKVKLVLGSDEIEICGLRFSTSLVSEALKNAPAEEVLTVHHTGEPGPAVFEYGPVRRIIMTLAENVPEDKE